MAVEAQRQCSYRKVGGLYLVGEGYSASCDRLPYELKTCPVCGSGIKFTRGFQWLDWARYAGVHQDCEDRNMRVCPVCSPDREINPYGLLWIGEVFYSPSEFIAEARAMGISRRIPAIPHKLKLGHTWILLAHKSACGIRRSEEPPFGQEGIPGIFYAFRPQRIEKLIWKSEAQPELLEDLKKSGITPVIIPDGDLDHDPATGLKVSDDEKTAMQSSRLFDNLRARLNATRKPVAGEAKSEVEKENKEEEESGGGEENKEEDSDK
jgi:hypothetical protein